jgi:hypothetical protein
LDKLKEATKEKFPIVSEYDCKAKTTVRRLLDETTCPLPPEELLYTPQGAELYQELVDQRDKCTREANEGWKKCEQPSRRAKPAEPSTPRTKSPPHDPMGLKV